MPSRSVDVEYWRNRTHRKVKDILIINGGKMALDELLIELSIEGYDTVSLAPLLYRFSGIVIEGETVSLRRYQKKIEEPQPQAHKPLTEIQEAAQV